MKRSRTDILGELCRAVGQAARRELFFPLGEMEWVRKWGWKTDHLKIWPREDAVIVNFTVVTLSERREYVYDEIGSVNLGVLLTGYPIRTKFPGFWLSKKAWVERVASNLALGWKWYERFQSPLGAINEVTRDENLSVIQKTRYRAYLHSLPIGQETVCCTITRMPSWVTDYTRSVLETWPRKWCDS